MDCRVCLHCHVVGENRVVICRGSNVGAKLLAPQHVAVDDFAHVEEPASRTNRCNSWGGYKSTQAPRNWAYRLSSRSTSMLAALASRRFASGRDDNARAAFVVLGLVPRTHLSASAGAWRWMVGTSPTMTMFAKSNADCDNSRARAIPYPPRSAALPHRR